MKNSWSVYLLASVALNLVLVGGFSAADQDTHPRLLSISQVRDHELARQLAGKEVEITGVVVADFRGPEQLGGVYLQDAAPEVSGQYSAMFLHLDRSEAISVGDQIHVRGILISGGDRPRLKPVDNAGHFEIRNDGFGERFHYDPVFDNKMYGHPTKFSRYPISNWSAWGWTGGGNGTTHVFASTRVPINYKTTEADIANYASVNMRMSAFGSAHPGGANFAFSDGSVRFLSEQINMVLFRALGTKQGRETIEYEH